MRTIWSPTRDLLQLHARLGRALGDPAVRRWGLRPRRGPSMPALDFSETRDSFTIRVDLPGSKKDDVEVKLADGSLEIVGEVPASDGRDEGALPRRVERFRGPFRRVVPLPRGANSEAVKASLVAGVLTLTIDKTVPDGGRRIEIA